jgi:hypothetical protein
VIHTRTGFAPSHHVHISLSQLVEYISEAAAEGGVEGRFNPDDATVKGDGELGILWTPWQSFKNGNLTHTGCMIFTLVKSKEYGRWIIVSSADSLVTV